MRRFLSVFLVFTIPQIAHTSCPNGFDLVSNGECRGFYGKMDLPLVSAVNTAITKCNGLHAQPVIIHNEEQDSYWAGRWKSGVGVILGLVCNASTSKWEWSDGSTVDYKPADGNYFSDLDKNCTTGGTWYMYYSNGVWTYDCDNSSFGTFDIYCTAQIHPKQDEISDDACEFFEDDNGDGVCYQVGASAENWNYAQLICRKLGANLASIHNQQENSFVRRLAVAKGAVTGLYLGATVSGKGGDFGWIDGTEWDYQNFYPGFPISGFGDCIAMDTSNSTGQWMNTECLAKFPVACVRERRVIPEPTCNSGPFKEGSIVTSPGFPYSASTPCDYYLKVDEGKVVEVEILLLEANSCCDNLVIYDGYIGGVVLANLTGDMHSGTYTTSSFNIMRVSWQPKGGYNVLGMAVGKMNSEYPRITLQDKETWHWNRSVTEELVSITSPKCPESKRGCLFGTYDGMLHNVKDLHAGIPLYYYNSEGRAELIGVTHGLKTQKQNTFTYTARLGTFLCLNIGLCKIGEDGSGDKFNPFADMHRILTDVDRFAKPAVFGDSVHDDNVETGKMLRHLADSTVKFLSEEENFELQNECGKGIASNRFIDATPYNALDLPWTGQLIAESNDETFRPLVSCMATIISSWHAITPLHCASSDPSTVRMYVQYGRYDKAFRDDITRWQLMEVKMPHIIFVLEYDFAILTFIKSLDTVSDAIVHYPCMVKPGIEYSDNLIHVYGNRGSSWCGTFSRFQNAIMCKNTYATFDIGNNATFTGDKKDPYWTLKASAARANFVRPSHGDSGAPVIRKSTDGKFVLDGFVVRVRYAKYPELVVLKGDVFHDLVCSYTGICSQGYLYYDPNKVPMSFNGGNGICPFEHPNRTKKF